MSSSGSRTYHANQQSGAALTQTTISLPLESAVTSTIAPTESNRTKMIHTGKSARPDAGHPLPWQHRMVAWLLRGFYFGRIGIVGSTSKPTPLRGGRLIVSSHRNGAIDGYNVLRAFPGVQFLTSVQLLRSVLLRLMFTGIPVVREKDRERYGIQRAAFGNPVDAGCAHLRAGGDLAIFPEGSSEWGYRPLPYQRGAARIACTLLTEGVPVEIVPVGLHYPAPDRFRSGAEVWVGEPITLPARSDDEAERAWENRVHATIAAALDEVSVNCQHAAEFAAAETYATAQATNGHSYAEAFLDAQRRLNQSQALPEASPRKPSHALPTGSTAKATSSNPWVPMP
jgi:1-acyl-sn-glycerol-3-phosphate acyltransferase